MSALSVQPTYPIFTDIDGQPLEDGYVWIGTVNLDPQTNPIAVFWDAALTIAAVQPIRTLAGYPSNSGTPARLYVNTDYSIRVMNKKGGTVYSAPAATERTNGNLVSYQPPFTGATATTVQDKLAQTVSVKDFGAVGDGVTNDTVAIQAAINSGKDLFFPAGTYLASNLVQSTSFQRFYAHGQVNIAKTANGVLLASAGDYVEFSGIQFLGTGYTGDNVTATGNHPRFINCSSYGAAGRALKATGSHVQVLGTCGIYATTDATATGYDIEIGVSGTATLYHQLVGVYTSQAVGGILLVDTGSHVISGGQFGKLDIRAGTSPAGINGGITTGARILGNVSVGASSAILSANQFSTVSITFLTGTSGCRLDASNVYAGGATVVNNGNSNNLIEREVSAGAGIKLRWGSDTQYRQLDLNNSDPTLGWSFDGSVVIPNTRAYRALLAGGSVTTIASVSSGDVLNIGGTGITRTSLSGASIDLNSTAGTQVQVVDGALRPWSDNNKTLGTAALRWSVVYAGTGAINTSDSRAKQDTAPLDDTEKRVAVAVKGLIKKFRFRDVVQAKGEGARFHVGVIAQEVMDAFQAEGLDSMRYGLICYDEWAAEDAVIDVDSGEIVTPARKAGNRYGVRYEELLAFIIGAI